MSRREALLSAGAVLLVALVVRVWAATQITYPRPEDVAYYVGVARNLVEGHGLTSDAIWSFGTSQLAFPRPAFDVWLPLPSFLAAIPMAIFGTTFAAAQISSVVVGSLVAVLAWRLAADVAAARGFSPGRARVLAVGAGLTAAVYLPLVIASVQPDSTMPFAALVLAACLLMTRLSRRIDVAGVQHEGIEAFISRTRRDLAWRSRQRVMLGVLIGLAALTRNEALWLALTFVVVEWWNVRGSFPRWSDRLGAWGINVIPVGLVAIITFAPWAIREWVEFGSPLPGQALTNALSLDGRDIFAFQDRPTLSRYLDAGVGKLLELRWVGTIHNLTQVLLFLGVPLSVLGLVGLPFAVGLRRHAPVAPTAPAPGAAPAPASAAPAAVITPQASPTMNDLGRPVPDPLQPLLLFSVITFFVASLVFPVSTTWGTFLHAAGAIHVLLVISALLVLDRIILWVGARRAWTNPVAWLGPAFAIAGCLLFSAAVLPSEGRGGRDTAARYAALASAFAQPGTELDLAAAPGPVITDFPIWLAEATRHHTLALPNESPDSILALARSFDPPARLVVVDAANDGVWISAVTGGAPRADCFVPMDVPVEGVLVFRIRCP
ncbi:MAG: hypothetical protein ABI620_06425 [Chloroflexota bacterium]